MNKKSIALFDIDKTIYDGYIIFPMAKYQLHKKIIDEECFDNLNNDLKLYKLKKVGYEETVENLNKHWAKGLEKQCFPYEDVLRTSKEFINLDKDRFYPYFQKLNELLNKTHDIYFVTGESQFIGEAVADYFKAKGFVSSVFQIKNNLFAGKIDTSLAKKEEKKKRIKNLILNYDLENSLAFGDSEGDIDMLKTVRHSICINPTAGLVKVAKKRNWLVENPSSVFKTIQEILHR